MMDWTTLYLFSFFPREVGIPRFTIQNLKQFLEYIRLYNGTRVGCHTSLYNVGNRVVLDKLFFDFDGLPLAFEEVKQFVQYLVDERKLMVIPVFSGRKGFHVYIPFSQHTEVDRQTLGYILEEVRQKIREEFNFKTLDSHHPNPSSMVRIPNTLNQTHYCTYLPFSFTSWSLEKIFDWARQKHYLHYYSQNGKKLNFASVEDFVEIGGVEVKQLNFEPDTSEEIRFVPTVEGLKDIIRPCIYEEITKPEPPHLVRVEFVIELMHLGYNRREVFEICRQLNWQDFDPNKTWYHINYIFGRKLYPYSCRKLRKVVECKRCGWNYLWI